MDEPPINQATVNMLQALPAPVSARYAEPAAVSRSVDDIPEDYAALSRRYSSMMGGDTEWIKYLQRPEVWSMCHLAPADEAVGLLAVA